MKNKVSFCITYYNQENFVKDSINSILSMDLPFDYEILVGDDGSTDNTVKNVNKFKEKYPEKIKLFIMPRKQGTAYNHIERASKNRLNLVKESSGEYIVFLDGDDYFCDKNHVTKSIKILEKDKSLIACTGNYKLVYEDGSENIADQPLVSGIIDTPDYIKLCYLPAGCSVFRNIWQKKHAYDKKLEIGFDDNVITLYMLQFGKMFYTGDVVYAYRQVQNSIWNSANKTEQNIINAMDYNILSSLLPEFDKYIVKRQFSAIAYVYKNKFNIKKLLGDEKYAKYLKKTENDFFVNGCVNYSNLSLKQKIKLFLYFRNLKRNNKKK